MKFITRFKIQIRNLNEKKMNQKGKRKKKKAMRLGRHCSFSAHFIHPPRGHLAGSFADQRGPVVIFFPLRLLSTERDSVVSARP
jgi:hypothetical protein